MIIVGYSIVYYKWSSSCGINYLCFKTVEIKFIPDNAQERTIVLISRYEIMQEKCIGVLVYGLITSNIKSGEIKKKDWEWGYQVIFSSDIN